MVKSSNEQVQEDEMKILAELTKNSKKVLIHSRNIVVSQDKKYREASNN